MPEGQTKAAAPATKAEGAEVTKKDDDAAPRRMKRRHDDEPKPKAKAKAKAKDGCKEESRGGRVKPRQ